VSQPRASDEHPNKWRNWWQKLVKKLTSLPPEKQIKC
jgi:hypothetical protein